MNFFWGGPRFAASLLPATTTTTCESTRIQQYSDSRLLHASGHQHQTACGGFRQGRRPHRVRIQNRLFPNSEEVRDGLPHHGLDRGPGSGAHVGVEVPAVSHLPKHIHHAREQPREVPVVHRRVLGDLLPRRAGCPGLGGGVGGGHGRWVSGDGGVTTLARLQPKPQTPEITANAITLTSTSPASLASMATVDPGPAIPASDCASSNATRDISRASAANTTCEGRQELLSIMSQRCRSTHPTLPLACSVGA